MSYMTLSPPVLNSEGKLVCPSCNSVDELPLLCTKCTPNRWVCSACWLAHDVGEMKRLGVIRDFV